MKGELDIPPFEFFGLTGEMPIKRLFVRDLKQAWYHRGVRRHGATIPEVARYLERIIAHLTGELRRRFEPEVVAAAEHLDRDLVTLWGYDHRA